MTQGIKKYDSIIIGSGQAGTPLAHRLATEGKKVALIEKGKLGGTCVNTGCTPTKMYVASARAMWEINNVDRLGISTTGKPKADLTAIKSRKDDLIGNSRSSIEKMMLDTKGITLIRGAAKFIGPHTLEVNGEELTSDQIFINVGARPRATEGFQKVQYYTNESILELEELPDHLIIIGGSYIGLEFAQMFRRFGSSVTIIERNDRLIQREDKSTSERIAEILKSEGISLELGSHCIGGKTFGEGVEVHMKNRGEQKRLRGSHLLMATGRQSNADLLSLNVAGIEHDEHFNISVSEQLETNIKGIYALGDCNGQGAFTHTSVNDFEIVEDWLFGEEKKKLSDRFMNYALYIDPPMGRVGLSRDKALEARRSILYGKMEMSDISRAKEKAETRGFMEVVIDAETERIIGATVLGTGGDEVIGVFITAMYSKISYKVLRDGVQTHPTITELIPTMLKSLKKIDPQ